MSAPMKNEKPQTPRPEIQTPNRSWVTRGRTENGMVIIELAQHACVQFGAVNAYIDEHQNWVCPRCHAIYGAVETPAALHPIWT